MKCGKPLLQEEQEFCYDCTVRKHLYTSGMALWVYDSNVRRSIADFKYHSRREYSGYYIKQLLLNYREDILRVSPDALIPVPLHRSKLKERGFNQATILAEGIGEELHINVADNFLIRRKKTLPQKGLNDVDRYKNLKDAFTINLDWEDMDLRKVMLIDDIYTTGSTIDACADVLISRGIKDVYFVSLSIGKGF